MSFQFSTLGSEDTALMQKWANDISNLSYLNDLKNEFDSIAINRLYKP
ncbi:hypothetical protein HYE36_05965 [Mycoplasmopsis bovis]|nr:hypothetical protein [Mycoplasmopsis bovis]WHL49568.1 hypothetical protein HYE36_05965 [Mycoplasmopsis bovis]